MRNNLRFAAFFLLAAAAFAQRGGGFRGGGFRGGFTTGLGFRSGNFTSRGFFGSRGFANNRRFGFGRRFDRDFLFPFYPFYPFYPFLDDYSYWPPPENFPVANDSASQLCSTAIVQPPPPPTVPAHPVIHDYNWNDQPSAGASNEGTFTIALKDGSRRSAVTTWVEDRSLHYIDPQDRQAVLSSDLIDRDITKRLNHEKNLHIELPPG
jgi:hypothetical protein